MNNEMRFHICDRCASMYIKNLTNCPQVKHHCEVCEQPGFVNRVNMFNEGPADMVSLGHLCKLKHNSPVISNILGSRPYPNILFLLMDIVTAQDIVIGQMAQQLEASSDAASDSNNDSDSVGDDTSTGGVIV